MKIEFTQQIF